MVTSSVALLVACVAVVTYDLVSTRHLMSSDLSTLARVIGTNSTASLAFDDRESAKEVLTALNAKRNIASASLYSRDGDLFASYARDAGVSAPMTSTRFPAACFLATI